jgi:hypothetical protein
MNATKFTFDVQFGGVFWRFFGLIGRFCWSLGRLCIKPVVYLTLDVLGRHILWESTLQHEAPVVFCCLNDQLSDLDFPVLDRSISYREYHHISESEAVTWKGRRG